MSSLLKCSIMLLNLPSVDLKCIKYYQCIKILRLYHVFICYAIIFFNDICNFLTEIKCGIAFESLFLQIIR